MNPIEESVKHLEGGGLVVFTAIPMDKTREILYFGLDLKHLYRVAMLPTGPMVGEVLMVAPPVPAMDLLDGIIRTVSNMAKEVGGAILKIENASPDKVIVN